MKKIIVYIVIFAICASLCSCFEKAPSGKTGFTQTLPAFTQIFNSVSEGFFKGEWFDENSNLMISADGNINALTLPESITAEFSPAMIKLDFKTYNGSLNLNSRINTMVQGTDIGFGSFADGAYLNFGDNRRIDVSYLYGENSDLNTLYKAYLSYMKLISDNTSDGDFSDYQYSISLLQKDEMTDVISLKLDSEKANALLKVLLSVLKADEATKAALTRTADLFNVITGKDGYKTENLDSFISSAEKFISGKTLSLNWSRYILNGKAAQERIDLKCGEETFTFTQSYAENSDKADSFISLSRESSGVTEKLLTVSYTKYTDTTSGTVSYNLRINADSSVIIFTNKVLNAWKSASYVMSLDSTRELETVFGLTAEFKANWKTDYELSVNGTFRRAKEAIDYSGNVVLSSSGGEAIPLPEGEHTVLCPSEIISAFKEDYPLLYRLFTGKIN